MVGFMQKLRYHLHIWLARRWADPALYELAERYGAAVVTAERHGKVVVPTYRAIADGELVGELSRRIHELERAR